MFKRLVDKLFPDTACEDAIVDMSLHRLRIAQGSLHTAMLADKLDKSAVDAVLTEATACVINASKIAIDFAGPTAKRNVQYENVLSGVLLGPFGARLGFAASEDQKTITRRCVRHLMESMKATRETPAAQHSHEQLTLMISSLVTTSVMELGLGDRESGSLEAVLLTLTMDQVQQSLSRIL